MARCTHLVTEIDLANGCRHTRYFLLGTESYRETMSFNAFFNGRKKRPNRGPRFLYHSAWLDEISPGQWVEVAENDAPITKPASIWDFYRQIGYDYKTKRYVETA